MSIPTTIPVREYEKFRESGATPGKTVVAVVFDEPQPVTIDNVTIENANLFVQLTHEDDSPTLGQIHDSVRVGDGTTELGITGSNEAKTSDADTHTLLTAIEADTTAIEADTTIIAGDTTSIDSKLNTLGQKTSAESVPVVLPSDQTVPISATSLPLPIGASTSALQTTGNSSLSSIDGKIANDYGASTGAIRTSSQIGNSLGAADFNSGNASAQTLRTVIASDQAPILTNESGFGTVSVDVQINVTSVTTALLTANSNRKFAFFVNSGGSTVWLAFGAAAVANRRIPLPSGSVYFIQKPNLWTGTVNAIKSGGGSVAVDVFEATI